MPSLFILLLSLGVSLRFSYNSSHGAAASPVAPSPPPTPPYHHHHHHPTTPGNKVVIVVHNEPSSSKPGSAPIPHQLITSEGQQRKEKRSNRKTILLPAGINRQGFLLAKPSPDETAILKNRKGNIQKIVHASPRHISTGGGGPSDIFGKTFHIHKTGTSLEKMNGNNPSIMEFRPHQPDITPDPQTGKLSLPVGYAGDALSGMKHISPTPMANQINPYTNGVASSFPPGIDPYEGFIRYAAENLDSPMGNMIDYHSLEHYYGPQHPLSPHHNLVNVGKGTNLDNHPYADSFAYGGKGGGSNEMSNSPPFDSPPPPVGTAGNNLDGFRARDNPDNNSPSSGMGGNSDYNSMTPYEHGIDHFHAPSPGLGSAPPIPRYGATTEASSYEDERENSPPSPPYGNMPPRPPFGRKPPSSPFKISASSRIPPPDLRVFEEGPPPELLGGNSPRGPPGPPGPPDHGDGPPDHGRGPPDHGAGPPGPGSGPPPPRQYHQQEHQQHEPHHHDHQPPHSENAEQGMTPQDGGDDSIWGILDIAEMLEKGEIPGASNDNNKGSSPSSNSRVVIPAYGGGAPPKGYGNQGPPSSSSPFEYDDDGGAGEGGNGVPLPHHPQSQYAPQESEEANDYEDQYSK